MSFTKKVTGMNLFVRNSSVVALFVGMSGIALVEGAISSISPKRLPETEAKCVVGGSGAAGCATTGACPTCTPFTCTAIGTGNTWACTAAGGTKGCSASGKFMSACAGVAAAAGPCTPISSPAVGSCGAGNAPAGCPTLPAGAPFVGVICDPSTLPFCSAIPGSTLICSVCQ